MVKSTAMCDVTLVGRLASASDSLSDLSVPRGEVPIASEGTMDTGC